MPSNPEPLVIRPRASLRTAILLSTSLVAASVMGWLMTPLRIRTLFTPLQVATLIFFVALMIAIMMAVGLSVVRVDQAGLQVRNGVRNHVLPWSEIKAFRFRPGDPWAYVLVRSEVEQLPLMGIQRTDGRRAEALVEQLREQLKDAYRGNPDAV